jgi:cytochrome c556
LLCGTVFALTVPNVRHSIERFFTGAPDARPEVRNPSPVGDLVSAPNRPPMNPATPKDSSSSGGRKAPLVEPPVAGNPDIALPEPPDQGTMRTNAENTDHLLPPIATVFPRVISLTAESSDREAPAELARQAVAARRGLFRVMGWAARPLLQVSENRTSIDAVRAAASAARIQSLTSMIAEVYAIDTRPFPVDTQSLDNIWTDARGFDLNIDELAKAAYALALAAQAHDNQAIVQAASQVGAACAGCHAAYRKQPDQPR